MSAVATLQTNWPRNNGTERYVWVCEQQVYMYGMTKSANPTKYCGLELFIQFVLYTR